MSTPTKYIGKVQIDSGNALLIGSTMYGICTTAAGTAAKKITTTENNSGKFINDNFDTNLQGVTIHVKFTNGNTATSGVTLLVGSTTPAREVVGNCTCPANTIISFTYDENQKWVVNDNVNTDTTYTFAEGSENGKFSVTPSGGSAQSVKVHGLAGSAYKGVVTDLTNNTSSTDLPTAAAVATYVSSLTGGLAGLTHAMHFRGVATSEPSGTTVPTGISDYATSNPEPGDVVIYSTKEYVWVDSTTGWSLLGDEGSYAFDNAVLHNSLLTAKGDMIFASAAGTAATLSIGTGNNKFLTVSGGAPVWGTVGKADVGLDNVTNYAQIEKRIGTNAGDIIYFSASATPARLGIGSEGQVLTVSSSNLPAWQTVSITDENVKQSPYSNGSDDRTFNILFKHSYNDTEETAGVYYSTVTSKKLTFNPSTGVLSAASFSGALVNTNVLTALGYDSSITTATFLRKDGAWKTISIDVTSNNSGAVLTDVTLTSGTVASFTQGTKAKAEVDSGVLIITNQGDDTFSGGTLPAIATKSKANLSIAQS